MYGRYRPKQSLRQNNFQRIIDSDNIVKEHLAKIGNIVQEKTYVEVGWPCYPFIPYFIKRYPNQIKIVQLVRHPVPFAFSLASHNFYNQELRNDNWIKFAQIDPFDPGIVQHTYREKWDLLDQYEKCLFHWSEIHDYGLEIKRDNPQVPYLLIKYEELISEDTTTLKEVLEFFGVSIKDAILQERVNSCDRHQSSIDRKFDYRKIENHPHTMNLMRNFGYDLSTEILKKYQTDKV